MGKLINTVEVWETVAVTALPGGWRNVGRIDVGDPFTFTPAPVVLIQHLAGTRQYYDVGGDPFDERVKFKPHTGERETRVVFGELIDGVLVAACDASDYITTLAPGQLVSEIEL